MVQEKDVIEISSKQEKTWAMFCHLGAFAVFVFPFGHILAPLIIWLVKRKELPFVDNQGKESLNFQISLTIYYFVAALATLRLIGFVLVVGIAVFNIIMVIIAAIKANRGEQYRYPLTIRFIK